MSTFDQVKDLPLKVEEYSLETLSFSPSPDFERLSTVIQISAGGLTGNGEDVTYDALDHIALADAGTPLDLTGPETVGEFCELIGRTDLFPSAPQVETSRQYRRWAFESAALDLALKQNSTDLSTHLGRPMLPLNFVASMRLAPFEGSSSIEPLMAKLERYPTLRFKLDAATDWDDGLLAALQETGAVDSFDLKGQYSGTVVDVETDPDLYQRLAERFPEAWLEDPDLTDETRVVLEPYWDRVTWDAPIHSIGDIEALEHKPRVINIKPSRLGGVESLFDAYDYCETNGIGAYGGGQWELGVGRDQIQYLASIFHPDTPNDTAPRGYNDAEPGPGLPVSPMEVPDLGFGLPK